MSTSKVVSWLLVFCSCVANLLLMSTSKVVSWLLMCCYCVAHVLLMCC
jgi:hypothetical protein